uniref:Uncharacterized protein n=1 Tax=Picea glauca TaxID=3330 RepID=A0A117NHG6_PICGL|nr:hypothetical protein ABT39_MTgene5365 [Picea glauca]QHR88960.1 hypothetical protein Q903MT_gene2979 [Picea sitchensis]
MGLWKFHNRLPSSRIFLFSSTRIANTHLSSSSLFFFDLLSLLHLFLTIPSYYMCQLLRKPLL